MEADALARDDPEQPYDSPFTADGHLKRPLKNAKPQSTLANELQAGKNNVKVTGGSRAPKEVSDNEEEQE